MKLFHILLLMFATTSAFAFNSTRLPNVEIEGRIGHGAIAADEMFPYKVGLIYEHGDPNNVACGGALIDVKWVLTAAHCVSGLKGLTVILGAVDVTRPVHRFYVTQNQIHIHPRFAYGAFLNDIALIKIPPVAISSRIKTISLPLSGKKPSVAYGIACGWGKACNEKNAHYECLSWTSFKIISNKVCRQTYPFLPRSSICVETLSRNVGPCVCKGDSGGPLVSIEDGTLIGILSFMAKEDYTWADPAVYVRVADYLKWIKKVQLASV